MRFLVSVCEHLWGKTVEHKMAHRSSSIVKRGAHGKLCRSHGELCKCPLRFAKGAIPGTDGKWKGLLTQHVAAPANLLHCPPLTMPLAG